MDFWQVLNALLLGLVEGLTEFIPVSSTGHLILAADLLGFVSPGGAFEVLIQFGAILAVCVVYFRKLLDTTMRLPNDPAARNFAAGLLIAFLPAAIVGVLLHDYIKEVLFSPVVVSVALIVGGIAILAIERMLPVVRHGEADRLPLRVTLGIGVIQCLSLIPGVSRSGATIMGALLLGVERRAAAEFSFFLAIPIMLGAFVYDLYKSWNLLNDNDLAIIAVGFVVSFISAYAVIKSFLGFVSRHGFAPFAWYRIAAGIVMLGVIYLR